MKRNALPTLCKTSALVGVMCLTACQADMDASSDRLPRGPIEFGASLLRTDEVRTRTIGLDSSYISSDPFNMDFYIQLCCDADDADNTTGADGNTTPGTYTEIGTYIIPSGKQGQLESKELDKALMWYDLTTPHTFYAWNIPWNEKYEDEGKNGGSDDDVPSATEEPGDAETSEWNERYIPSEDGTVGPMTIHFFSSHEGEDGYGKYKNNKIYENFIGAKSIKPYSYKGHGKYVDLTFHHLVSKIRIGSFILIEPGGAIQKHLQANITFIGMPTTATFYPHPEDGGRPRVEPVPPEQYDKDNGVTFFLSNEATKEDEFYICPEIDFSEIDFQVKVTTKEYSNYDTYYGTFDDVNFTRTPGNAYDNQDGKDSKILHAAEVMTLNIVLIPGIGPGLAIIINPWNTDNPEEAPYHPYPGIYSDVEVKAVHGFFAKQTDYNDENIEKYFELYGQTREVTDDEGNVIGEERIFPLYGDVSIIDEPDANIFPIPNGYTVDGMGHTITMKTNNGTSHGYVKGPYFNIGSARDIYLTDGTNSIYIDADGGIWRYDAATDDYVDSGYKLTPLTGNNKSYDISCVDGNFCQSEYYNTHITQ